MNQPPILLLIEDDPDVRVIVSMVLEGGGYHVVEAADGREGFKKLAAQRPDAILCDLMMPEMDGYEFVEKIAASPDHKDIPLIILTALDDEANEKRLRNAGATDFLSKACSAGEMLQRIGAVVETED